MAIQPLMAPRKIAAGENSDGNFGVGPIGSPIAHPDRAMDTSKTLADAQRSTAPNASRGPGKVATERQADHGPHNHPAGKR